MAILNPSLHRRRSQPLPSVVVSDKPKDVDDQPPTNRKSDGSPRQPFVTSGLLIRKVSNIFSGRSKTSATKKSKGKPAAKSNLRHAPVGHIAVSRSAPGGGLSTTPSPSTESFDSDIRQPSGLGRLRTGSLTSNGDGDNAPYERVRALSTPTLLRPQGLGVGTVRGMSGGRSVPRVPQTVLNLIVSFLPRRHVPRVALVSWAFCDAARATLFAHLDARSIRPVRFVKLITLLSTRHDLALLTDTLTIHVWPPSFHLEGETQVSMLAESTPTFAKALLNMHRLKTLTLPSFEYTLMRYFSPLMLTKATFLNHTMSVGEQLQLRTWLECQEELRHLVFPVLVEKPNDAPSLPTPSPTQTLGSPLRPTPEGTPISTPVTPAFSFLTSPLPSPVPSSPARPRTSPQPSPLSSPLPSPLPSPRIAFPKSSVSRMNTLNPILPRLETLTATPNLATSLLVQSSSSSSKQAMPSLRHINLRIHKSLYTGLRPSTVMQAIACRGTRGLTLSFSEDIDPRTVEKVLTSVGALLGRVPAEGVSSSKALVGLSVVLENTNPGDEELYKIMNTILARFKSLQMVELHRPASDIPHSSLSGTFKAPKKSAALHSGKKEINLSDTEQFHLGNWLKFCPTLREITFPSGAQWEDVASVVVAG